MNFHAFPFLLFCAIILVPTNVQALIWNDGFDARILKVNEENVMVLDRGIEDGVERGDHAKITNSLGFVARAIALRTGMMTSHWKVYRVVYPEKMSKDLTYQVRAINQHKVPDKYAEFKEEDMSAEFTDFNESELVAWGRKEDENTVATDLPKNMLGDPVLEVERDFGSRNFNAEQFQEDFKRWTFQFGIPAFSFASNRKVSRTRSVNTNFVATNVGKKYNFNFTATRAENKTEQFEQDENDFDPSDGIDLIENITRDRTDSQTLTFSIFNIIPRLAATSTYSRTTSYLNDEKQNITTNVSPLGLAITAIQGPTPDDEPYMTINVNPGYNKTRSFYPNGQYNEEGNIIFEDVRRTFSLSVGATIQFQLGVVAFSNETSWAPQIDPQDYNSWSTGDVNIENVFNVSFPISTRLSGVIEHNYQYSFIPQFGVLGDQKQDQTISMTLTYSLTL
jgi:hypothetical protein